MVKLFSKNMAKLHWLMLAMLACSYAAEAYKILVVFPFPGKSHTILGNAVVRHLVDAGHEVTYITPIIRKNVAPNLRQIDVSDNFKAMKLVVAPGLTNPDKVRPYLKEMLSLKNIMDQTMKLDVREVFKLTLDIHNLTFHNENVQRLLKDPKEHFDVIVNEWMFNELYSTFSAVFQTPYVWVSTVQPHWMVLKLVHEMPNPAYTSDIMTSAVPPFSFFERIKQLGYQIVGLALQNFYLDSKVEAIYEGVTPFIKQRGHEVPTLNELRYNVSLVLSNSHVSIGPAVSLPQNYIPIGGYHIETDLKPLPEDLQKLMDNAKDGVIYFSMGSNLKSKDLPVEVTQNLLKVFGGLKQTVLWKFEEVLPGLPSNVHILQWAPQPAILAHPNCKLFITHGGLLSTTETIYFAKPVIGIPVFADQFVNVERAVKLGYAKKVDLSYAMADELKEAINELLVNPSYTNKAQELSFIYHHRPVSPGQELVHWVEHVIKTRGAPHLRSPALHVPFYQKFYFDLAALILAVLYTIKLVFKRIFRKRETQKKQKKN